MISTSRSPKIDMLAFLPTFLGFATPGIKCAKASHARSWSELAAPSSTWVKSWDVLISLHPTSFLYFISFHPSNKPTFIILHHHSFNPVTHPISHSHLSKWWSDIPSQTLQRLHLQSIAVWWRSKESNQASNLKQKQPMKRCRDMPSALFKRVGRMHIWHDVMHCRFRYVFSIV